MRIVYAFILFILLGALMAFAVQNSVPVTVKFLNSEVSTTLALLAVALYGLGMLTGWSLLGAVRRSFKRTMASPRTEA